MMMRRLGAVSLLGLLLCALPAQADTFPREGFVIGAGGGYGHFWTEAGSDDGFALTLHAGFMLTERTALLLDTSSVCDRSPGLTFCHSLFGPAVQFWVGERFWLKAGLGGSQNRVFGDLLDDSSDVGYGVLAAAGASVARRGSYSLDLQARLTTARIESVRYNTFAIMVTFNHE
jgi:hypothetical protein